MPALDLVAAGADVNLADKDGWTALMFAAKEGTLAAARAIIRSPRQSSLDALAKETSALSLAAERGRHALVRALIEAGAARPQARDRRAGAAARGAGRARRRRANADGGESAARVLRVGERADLQRRRRPRPVAGRGGACSEAGLDPDQVDRSGQTALMKAAAGGHDKAVASLLRLGAAPDVADRDGWTALMHAAAPPSSGSVPAIRDLVRAGAAVNRRAGPNGKTPLMIAAEKGNELATDELLRSRRAADLKSGGKTALDFALAEGNKRCAERLGYVEKAPLAAVAGQRRCPEEASASLPSRDNSGGRASISPSDGVEVHDAGPQHEPAADERVGQKRFAALLHRRQQVSDSAGRDSSPTVSDPSCGLQVRRHVAKRRDAEALASSPRTRDAAPRS